MSCCCAPNLGAVEGTNEFFNSQASRYKKYFRKKGLHKEQKYLVDGIRRSGIAGAEILEIGCGVGGLHLSLLKAGAAKATGFDISEKMIATARQLATEMSLQDRAQYWRGDFVAMHESAPMAEVTVLDKVICCYENARELISRSTAKTRRLYAVSYPRENFFVKIMFRSAKYFLKLFGQSFHPHYHEPRQVQDLIVQNGFEKVYEHETLVWLVQVFGRRGKDKRERNKIILGLPLA
jgi:magnesium-protoporphyrin O-methyltransferase